MAMNAVHIVQFYSFRDSCFFYVNTSTYVCMKPSVSNYRSKAENKFNRRKQFSLLIFAKKNEIYV